MSVARRTNTYSLENSLIRERDTLIQTKAKLQQMLLQNFHGSEEQRSLIENKFKEIETVIKELNHSLEYATSLGDSSKSDEISNLIDRFNRTKAKLDVSQTLHQRSVDQKQKEIDHISKGNLRMRKEVNEVDQCLGIDTRQERPKKREKDPSCCDDCVVC